MTLLKFDDSTATQILREIKFWQILKNGQKMSFMAILETLNFKFWRIWDLKVAQNSEPLKLPKMTFLDHLNSPKFDYT